ncbi:MAG: FtsX-like permease family protein [Clostridium sp.]
MLKKFNSFTYLFLNALKSLKRHSTLTIYSTVNVAIACFIFGIIFLYMKLINMNADIVFKHDKELVHVLEVGGVFVLSIILLVVILLLFNTFKMAVIPRKDEISIMRVIGATNWFIRVPFIIEGVIIGIVGAIMGSYLLLFLYTFICNEIINITKLMDAYDKFSFIEPEFITNIMIWIFIIAGAIMCSIVNMIILRRSKS